MHINRFFNFISWFYILKEGFVTLYNRNNKRSFDIERKFMDIRSIGTKIALFYTPYLLRFIQTIVTFVLRTKAQRMDRKDCAGGHKRERENTYTANRFGKINELSFNPADAIIRSSGFRDRSLRSLPGYFLG